MDAEEEETQAIYCNTILITLDTGHFYLSQSKSLALGNLLLTRSKLYS